MPYYFSLEFSHCLVFPQDFLPESSLGFSPFLWGWLHAFLFFLRVFSMPCFFSGFSP
jgi:hypothetical protein